ncbi:MAG: zinc-binding alcohol dehydrogenase [Solirubrobacteraceae bacterium]|nr:zinc-binding alcohol dehydrogenase [Solirubrobacteraceae bacterium]
MADLQTSGRAVWFDAARSVELRDDPVRDPAADEVGVSAICSLISPGTEMLVYRGEVAAEDDLGLETCEGSFGFPIKYAYQVVGRVERAGDASGFAPGELVFARHPHQERFTMRANPDLIFKLPPDLDPRRAVFANLLDVALTVALDVPVRFGDCVVVYGQGIVGSFCAQLARRTAGSLIVVDPIERRRKLALSWGADLALAPDEAPAAIARASDGRGADISIEATGAPPALQAAIDGSGQEATVVAVSYFGTRLVPLLLAPAFHYRRLRIVSSMVAGLGSGLEPRWSFARRIGTAFDLLGDDRLVAPVTHAFELGEAAAAYELIDTAPEQTLGVLLEYP